MNSVCACNRPKRLAAWERQPEQLWQTAPVSSSCIPHEKKLALLRETLEPMLQRELEYRGITKGDLGFEAKLIGWIEMGRH
jgi:hypothetical protein